MRETRFRAWDKKQKCYVPDGLVQIDSRGTRHWLLRDLTWLMPSKDDALDIQFYIGCKDKKNKEICFGDVATYSYLDGKGEERHGTGVVAWNEQGYIYLTQFGNDEAVRPIWEVSDIVIIGNTMENPELLKKGRIK